MPSLHLSPDPDSPSKARRFVTRVLQDSNVGHRAIADAALLTTELVTNAVIHARTAMRLDVAVDPDVVHIAVSDSDLGRPVVRAQNNEASTGRGLYVVDQVARDWQVVYGDSSKTVMVSIATGDAEARP